MKKHTQINDHLYEHLIRGLELGEINIEYSTKKKLFSIFREGNILQENDIVCKSIGEFFYEEV